MRLNSHAILPLLLVCFLLFFNTSQAQLSNVKVGLWSNTSTWQNNKIPTAADDVILQYDVIIDQDANCRSLNSNGHTVTVNSGVHFDISSIPAGSNDDSVLSRVILIDTTLIAPNDTLSIQEYFYDIQQRLISVTLTESYKTDDEYFSFINYQYDGDDTLPNKLSEDETFILYRSYDAQGFIIKDSVNIRYSNLDEEPDHTNNFSYHGDSIFLKIDNYSYFPTSYDTVVQTFSNGNVVTQRTLSSAGGYGDTFQLDNHPNPMYKGRYYFNFDGPLYSGDSTFAVGQQKNNYTEIKNADKGSTHNQYIYQYVYKQNGYPIFFRSYNISSGLPVYAGTGIYKYRK